MDSLEQMETLYDLEFIACLHSGCWVEKTRVQAREDEDPLQYREKAVSYPFTNSDYYQAPSPFLAWSMNGHLSP